VELTAQEETRGEESEKERFPFFECCWFRKEDQGGLDGLRKLVLGPKSHSTV
jgi:hypothetical protein